MVFTEVGVKGDKEIRVKIRLVRPVPPKGKRAASVPSEHKTKFQESKHYGVFAHRNPVP